METTLETLKNTYAQEQGYEDWNDIRKEFREKAITFTEMTGHENEICIRAQKAALEKKIERMKSLRNVYDAGSGQHNILSLLINEFQNPENLIR